MFRHRRYRRKCRALANNIKQPNLVAYFAESAALKADKLVNTPLIAVDLEMTGMDATKNQIIAMGWTQLDKGRIRLASNHHLLINSEHSVGHSAGIHELTDNEIARGVTLPAALETLFEAARGRVWLFHHAGLDVAFLRRACFDWLGVSMPFMVLDTLHMELALRKRRNLPVHHGDLQLGKLRSNYHLPGYTAHNALIDACATAEVMLAIAQHLDPSDSLSLLPHLKYY